VQNAVRVASVRNVPGGQPLRFSGTFLRAVLEATMLPLHRAAFPALLALAGILTVLAGSMLWPATTASCFRSGAAQYQITKAAQPTYTVRFVADETADFNLQLVETPDTADVVLMDEGAAQPCSAIPTQTIRVDAADAAPSTADVTVHLSSAPDAHKLYVRSVAFTREEAAALIAVLWRQQHGTHRQALAQRH
jgi:hypothetical protein